ncbi:MAG: hypothetical protein V3V05_05460 [Pontiella sp.]
MGTGTRSCDVLNALRNAAPDLPVIIKTDLPPRFMARRLGDDFDIRRGAFDVGFIQKDSIHVDLEASIQTVENLYEREEELIAQEVTFMREENIGVVVADIPAIPLAAAQHAGISNIACSNFGWDWIYSEFIDLDPRWKIYVDKFSAVYTRTDLLLRQPFSEPMSAFPNQINLPLLAKPGTNCREIIAKETGADPSKKWVLLSFTTIGMDNNAKYRSYQRMNFSPLKHWNGQTPLFTASRLLPLRLPISLHQLMWS